MTMSGKSYLENFLIIIFLTSIMTMACNSQTSNDDKNSGHSVELLAHKEGAELHYERVASGEICATGIFFTDANIICYQTSLDEIGDVEAQNPTLDFKLNIDEKHTIIGLRIEKENIYYITFKGKKLYFSHADRADLTDIKSVEIPIELSISDIDGIRHPIETESPFIFNSINQRELLRSSNGKFIFPVYVDIYSTILIFNENIEEFNQVETSKHTTDRNYKFYQTIK